MSILETPTPKESKVPAQPSPPLSGKALGLRLRSSLQQLLAFGSLIVLVVFFGVMNSRFLLPGNLSDILLSTVVIGLLALGATFVIITGGIDLSVGTGMSLCSVMVGVVLTYLGLPMWAGVVGGILMGALIGAVNGFLISFLKIPPFIATLATMLVAQGMALVVSGTKPIYFTGTEGFSNLALGKPIAGLVIPNAVFIFFAAATIAGVVLAGVIIAARLNSAQPGQGMGYELQAIAAVVIGGTSLAGGKGSIVGTVIGALIMSVLTNGLRIISVPQEWQNVAIGVVILVAVYLDMLRRKEAAT